MSLNTSSYKGTRDLYPVDMAERRYIFAKCRQLVESYGYQEYMAPMLEPIDLFAAKSGEEIVNEQTYSFTDRGGRQVVIRPEMTPSITRMVAARRQEIPMPARLYSIANFMRYERPQHGREREFWQLNFDLFGVPGVDGDIEIIGMSHDLMRSFGADESMFTVRVNDRRLTNYIMGEYLSLDDDQAHRMIKLLDRFDKMPRADFDAAAVEIIGKDGLSKLENIINCDSLDNLPGEVLSSGVVDPLRQLLEAFDEFHIYNIVYDPRLMRGFDYYTGIVFEVFDESPANRRAVFGGGRYDGLVAMFGVEALPVVGVAPGETMLREFLLAHDLMPDFSDYWAPDVVVLPMSGAERAGRVASVVAGEIRKYGYSTVVDYTERKLDKKTKVAVKRNAKWLIYVGENEIATNRFPIKDVATGESIELPSEALPAYLMGVRSVSRLNAMAEFADMIDGSFDEEE